MKVNNIYSLMLAVDAGAGLAALPDYMVGDNKGLVEYYQILKDQNTKPLCLSAIFKKCS